MKQDILITYKVLNLINSKTFEKRLERGFKGLDNKIILMQEKLFKDLKDRINRSTSTCPLTDLLEFYSSIVKDELKIKTTVKERSGIIDKFGVKEYESIISTCVYFNKLSLYRELGQKRFNLCEMLHEIANYLLFKDTVLNGSGNLRLDRVIKKLISTKSEDYFIRGYPYDLFVHDRVFTFHNSNDFKRLWANKEYLSTYTNNHLVIDTNRYHCFEIV